MIPARSYVFLALYMVLLLIVRIEAQGSSSAPASSAAAQGSTNPPTASATETGTTTNTTCKNYAFLCELGEIEMIALLVAPGVGLLLISVAIAVCCGACRRRDDDDDEIFLERERTSQMVMNDYRSNMAASSVDGDDDFTSRQKTNPAYMEDDERVMPPFGRPSVSSGSDRMGMDNSRRQRMSMASVDRPYGEDQRRPGPHYPEDDMRHPPAADPRGRPAQYGDDPRRAGPRYMEEDRRPPPDSRGRPYGHPGDRDDGRRPPAPGPMYDRPESRGGPRPQPRESVAAGKRNWAKQSAAPRDVPPADYDDGSRTHAPVTPATDRMSTTTTEI